MPVRLAIAFSLLLGVLSFPSPASAQTISCNQFDSWIWAQTVFLDVEQDDCQSARSGWQRHRL